VANTIVLENAVKIMNSFNKNNNDKNKYDVDVVNVSISYGKKISAGYMMIAKNPIIIITIKASSEK
jgi:cobalt-precorrin-6B (C15)-methyltransferase